MVFVISVIHIVCSKTFLRERRDAGIYKALGFTLGKPWIQFAVRFFIVATLGAAVESGFAAVFAGEMLSFLLRFIGISNFKVTFHVAIFALLIAIICMCFFAVAFVSLRKIKNMEVSILIME